MAVLADVTGWLTSGAAGLTWNEPGIVSSAAAGDPSYLTTLGALLNRAAGGGPLYPSFAGQSVDANAILVGYAHYGDANLDGVVDRTDYARIENGFWSFLDGWTNGDFDYSHVVDGTDFALIDNAFNSLGGPLAAGPIPRAAGEPAAASHPSLTLPMKGRELVEPLPIKGRESSNSISLVGRAWEGNTVADGADPFDLVLLDEPSWDLLLGGQSRGRRRR